MAIVLTPGINQACLQDLGGWNVIAAESGEEGLQIVYKYRTYAP